MTRPDDIGPVLLESDDPGDLRAAGSRRSSARLPKPTPAAVVVGRSDELRRMRAAHDDVSVAIVFGIPGVGKSSLARAYASSWDGPVAYVKVEDGSRLSALVNAVDELLFPTWRKIPDKDEERLMALWEAVGRDRSLVIVDDLHALAVPDQRLVVDSAAVGLGHARLVAISRELVPRSPGSPDRMELRLEPLDQQSSRALWKRLEDLYGPGGDFPSAWQRSRGSPVLLRRAHITASAGHERDPLALAVRALTPPERRLANAFAIARRPLPLDLVMGLPGGKLAASLQTLVTRLIVDRQPDGAYQMHELWREAVTCDLDAAGRRLADEDLVAALAGSTLAPLVKVKETSWHLRSLGRHAEIGALLVAQGEELLRRATGPDVLRMLDELPAAAMTDDLGLLRARTAARTFQIRRAFQELCALVERGGQPPSTILAFGSTATVLGELDRAHRTLRELARTSLDPAQAARVQLGLAWNCACRGDPGAARRWTPEPMLTATGPLPRGLDLHLFLLMLEGQHERAAHLASDSLRALRADPEPLRSRRLAPVLCALALASGRRFDDAEQLVSMMEHCQGASADRIEIAWSRMMIRAERGERVAPLAYLSEAQEALDRGGHLPGAIWTRAVTCRLLFLLGRRREALAQLAWMRELCAHRETSAYDRIIARAAAEDPLALSRVASPPAPAADVAARVRAIVRLIFVDRIADDQLLADIVLPDGPDHGFDRALVELARAGISHHRGQLRLETQCLARAVSQAATAGADLDLVPLLFEAWLGLAPRSSAREAAGEEGAVIDGIRHEIRIGARRIPLRARPVSRQLLYAFAAAPSHYLARNAIARVLWGIDYDPLRHECTLKSNIRRLRMLLAGFAELPSETGGYCMVLPDGVEFIPPVVTGQPPSADS